MDKILVFTDIHITKPGQTIIGLDPAARFAQGLAHALHHHADAKAIIITGDLTHYGSRTEYRRLKDILADCPLPVHLMLGNHDRRAGFHEVFGGPEGFVQFRLDFGEHTLLCLDTKDDDAPDHHSGYLCATRLTWLDQQIKEAKGRIVTVLCHHPPHDVGFPGMDSIKIRNGRALLARGNGFDQLICGHVHRTIMGHIDGLSFAMLKSPCHQAPLDFDDTETASSIDEPGAYGVLCLMPKGVVVHTEDFTLPDQATILDGASGTSS
ncbi:metallophosphoesterase [Algirhabdus cladophorae]|uniref:metallophosphoesterase n=1 Tax=Algirhabdus cladophorae TaxID=3377108 RepID=UPI003B84536E